MELQSDSGVIMEPFYITTSANASVPRPLGTVGSSPVQNTRLAFTPEGPAIFNSSGTVDDSGNVSSPAFEAPQDGLNMGIGLPMKRKRGRPRKYGPHGTLALEAASGGLSPLSAGSLRATVNAESGKKKGRQAIYGKKKQLLALGPPGIGFTPHIITVLSGEDVSSKIMGFSQHGPRAICVLSANGAVSNVTLRQAATSGGTVTYEGRFEILSLSGSYLLLESGGQRSRTGGLSISLAGPDGRVLGGGVAGLLTAASPVQVVLGSFISEGLKEPNFLTPWDTSSGGCLGGGDGTTAGSSPPSHDGQSDSSGDLRSSLPNPSNNNTQQDGSGIPWKLQLSESPRFQ